MGNETTTKGAPASGFLSRRQALTGAGGAAVGFAAGWLARDIPRGEDDGDAVPRTPQEALDRLKAGNERFRTGRSVRHHQGRGWRHALTAEQRPFASVLGCSDSRVPVELVFDEGFGDLFIVRVAGNVISPAVLGSLAYALAHIHTPLMVVLGHEGCGAVTAALPGPARHDEPQQLEELLRLIEPGLRGLDPGLQGPDRLSAAVEANVRWSLRQFAELPFGRRLIADHAMRLAGAVYDLDSGRVRFLDGDA
jgi:carbonic anhydrase